MRIGLYPGTFDPVTLGHLDVIERALKVVDHLVVAVADNPGKGPLFSTKHRVKMLETDLANNRKIAGKSWEVVPFSKLLMEAWAAYKEPQYRQYALTLAGGEIPLFPY